jgi:glycosyltransferase involved in cell wall biosynthesis
MMDTKLRENAAPKVSVLMTSYNAMPFLTEAIDSILKQDFPDFEFIIVNDGSTDATTSYLDNITDSRVNVFHCPNRGTSAASNFGLAHCRGVFVARMDADDFSLPHRLSTQVKFLEQHLEVGLVGSHIRVMGSKKIGLKVDLPTEHDEIYSSLLKIDHSLNHGVCMFRRSLINKIGGYWSHRSYDDWDMFIRMGEISRLANIDDVLNYYRLLTTSLVGNGLWEGRRYYAYAAELARRRVENRATISFDEFCKHLDSRPIHQRMTEFFGNHALNQYRIALADICCGKPLRGKLRLCLAAACSPRRTVLRLQRMLGSR